MHTRGIRRAVALVAAMAASVALVGCGPAPWTQEQADPSPKPKVSVAAPVPNDLASGSTARELTAGAVVANVDYWSTLSMDRWTPGAVKPISISLVTTVTPDDGQKVYLQKATMVAFGANEDKTFAPLDPQVDASSVSPGYLVLAPYSYSQTFNVGPVDDAATHVTVQFTYDFLVQTTPTSNEFAKQTATDTLTVAIAQPAVESE